MGKNRIWIVGHYTMPPKYEVRIKTLMWAKYLMEAGYEVTLISASTLHNTDINLINNGEKYIFREYDNYHFIHINCSSYSGSGVSRVRNLLQFAHRFKKYAHEFGELPDVILAADIHCVNFKPIGEFAKKNQIKFIVDIRDLWPESIVEFLDFSRKNPIIKYLYYREKTMYQMADNIIFSMEGGKQYIVDKGWENLLQLSKVGYINNGIDLEKFNSNSIEYTVEDVDLLNKNTYKIIYTGSIRKANNLQFIVDVADSLQETFPDIVFLIYGDGNERKKLEEQCKKKNSKNIIFKGYVNNKYIPFILMHANINILHYSYHDIFKYGGSQNKMFDYLAAGKPIISTIKMGYDIIESNDAGFSLKKQTVEECVNAIKKIYQLDDQTYLQYCINAKKTAKRYDFQILTKKLIKIIEGAE